MEIHVLVGRVVEFGKFQSVRSRMETDQSKNVQEKRQRKRRASNNDVGHPGMTACQGLTKDAVEKHKAELKAAINKVLDLIEKPMPTKFFQQRNV